jgi:hypothetical protein
MAVASCLLLPGMVCSTALGDMVTWSFQQVDSNPRSSSNQIALAMAAGARWPKVVYEKSLNGGSRYIAAASLKPTGWTSSYLSSTPLASAPSNLGTARSPDGHIGVVWRNGTSVQAALSNGGGWGVSTVGTMASAGSNYNASIAYGPDNQPVVAYTDTTGLHVNTFTGGQWDHNVAATGSLAVASVAMDSLGQAQLVYRRGPGSYYSVRSTDKTTWMTTSLPPSAAYRVMSYSLALGPNDEPAFTYLHGSTLEFGVFDLTSGKWQMQTLATDVMSQRVNMVFDSQGRAGLAFVRNQSVNVMLNDGGAWSTYVLPTGANPLGGFDRTPNPTSEACLAFDAMDVPVVAYYSPSGVMLAYDPVVSPEPTTLLMLMGAGLVLVRKR